MDLTRERELCSADYAGGRRVLAALLTLAATTLAQVPSKPTPVPSIEVGVPLDTLLVSDVGITPEDLAAHEVRVGGELATSTSISLWGWQPCNPWWG